MYVIVVMLARNIPHAVSVNKKSAARAQLPALSYYLLYIFIRMRKLPQETSCFIVFQNTIFFSLFQERLIIWLSAERWIRRPTKLYDPNGSVHLIRRPVTLQRFCMHVKVSARP